MHKTIIHFSGYSVRIMSLRDSFTRLVCTAFLVCTALMLLAVSISARADILEFNSLFDLNATTHGLESSTDIAITENGQYVYVVGSFADTLGVFERDIAPASLTANRLSFRYSYTDGENGISGLLDPWKVVLSPASVNNNQYIYVISHTLPPATDLDTLTVFTRNLLTGEASFLESYQDSASPSTMGTPEDIVVSPDGNHIYVASGDTNTVSVFEFIAAPQAPNSHLILRQTVSSATVPGLSNLLNPRAMAISPDGAHIYVAATNTSSILAFQRNSTNGTLSYQSALDVTEGDVLPGGVVSGLIVPSDIQVSPDGNHVYVAGFGGSSVVAFSRNSSTGALDYVETYSDGGAGINTVDGLTGIYALRISPDGNYVVAASSSDIVNSDLSLTAFIRDSVTGELTPDQIIQDDVAGSFGIINGTNFEFTQDNRALYTLSTAASDGKIGIYNNCLGALPIANAGNDSSAIEGSTQPVQLDGSTSTVPCGETASYSWQQVQGPDVTINNGNTAIASFIPDISIDQNTNLVFELTVTRNNGVNNTDTVTVEILNANDPPVLNNDLCIIAPNTDVTINVLANDVDLDGPSPLQVLSRVNTIQGVANFTAQNIRYHSPVLEMGPGGALIPAIDTILYNATDSLTESATDAEVKVLVNALPEPQDHIFEFDSQTQDAQTLYLLTNNQLVLNNPVIILPENMQSLNGGMLAVNTNGTVSYTPPVNNTGASDEFVYTVISEESRLFAEQNGVQLVSDNPACLQATSTGRVTINFTPADNTQKPADNTGGGESSRSHGGGSLIFLNLILLLYSFVRKRTKITILNLPSRV